MSRSSTVAALLATSAVAVMLVASFASPGLDAATPAIKPSDVLEHVRFLSADDMKGRASGTPELERAAAYIASRFEAAGLTPGGDDGGWFQPFELDAGIAVGGGNALTINTGGGVAVPLTLGESYYPMAALAGTTPGSVSTTFRDVPLVFAGYGISAPGLRYDDYGGLDVRGKVVLVFSHEPQEYDRRSRMNGNQPIPETSLFAKARAARDRGAIAVLIASDPAHEVDQGNYAGFSAVPDAEDIGIPVLRVRRVELNPLITAWGLDAVARAIDGDLVPRSRALDGVTVNYNEVLSRNRRAVRNVVGVLRATGTKAHEAIVIGAHYDHVGLGGRYSAAPERTGEIHNGADDNASGTASIIEMARAAAADGTRFPRTLIFVAFAGEELGLLGSSYYARHPAMPIANTVAMLNLDMVGRLRGPVDVSGLESAPSLVREMNAAVRATGGIRYQEEGPGSGRSDDFPFLEAGVPAINFFTGFHTDYHRPSDDWQRINVVGTARIARLALELAARIAARPARPDFTPQPR